MQEKTKIQQLYAHISVQTLCDTKTEKINKKLSFK